MTEEKKTVIWKQNSDALSPIILMDETMFY